jgi:hypothetical protein
MANFKTTVYPWLILPMPMESEIIPRNGETKIKKFR